MLILCCCLVIIALVQCSTSNETGNLTQQEYQYHSSIERLQNQIQDLEELIAFKEKSLQQFSKSQSSIHLHPDLFENYDDALIIDEENNKQKELKNMMKKRFSTIIDGQIKRIDFIPLKQMRGQYNPNNVYILVALTSDSNIILIDMNGKVHSQISAGHDVYRYSILQHIDEFSIITLGSDYVVKIFQINSQILQQEDQLDNITTTKNKTQLNYQFSMSYDYQFQCDLNDVVHNLIGTIEDNIASMNTYYSKNTKFVLLGDTSGLIHVYYINGTKRGKSVLSRDPIVAIKKHHPYLIYASKKSVGFFNPFQLQIVSPQCETPFDEVIHIAQDNQHSQNFFVLLRNLEILIYDTKSQKSQCQIVLKLNSDDKLQQQIDNPRHSSLVILQNFLMLINNHNPICKIFNITNYKNAPTDVHSETGFYLPGISNQTYQITQSPNPGSSYIYRVQRHTNALSFLLFTEGVNNQTQLSLAEFTTVTTSQFFSFGFLENVRFPMILVVVFVVFFIKFCHKGKKSDNIEKDEYTKAKIDSLISDFSRKQAQQGNSLQEEEEFDQDKDPSMPEPDNQVNKSKKPYNLYNKNDNVKGILKTQQQQNQQSVPFNKFKPPLEDNDEMDLDMDEEDDNQQQINNNQEDEIRQPQYSSKFVNQSNQPPFENNLDDQGEPELDEINAQANLLNSKPRVDLQQNQQQKTINSQLFQHHLQQQQQQMQNPPKKQREKYNLEELDKEDLEKSNQVGANKYQISKEQLSGLERKVQNQMENISQINESTGANLSQIEKSVQMIEQQMKDLQKIVPNDQDYDVDEFDAAEM